MARVQSQKIRQAVLVTGDPVDSDTLPEKLELFNEDGEALMIGGAMSRYEQVEPSGSIVADNTQFTTLTAYPGIRLLKIETDRPARIRVYNTEEYRAADLDRGLGIKPSGDHGRLLEVVTTADLLELTLSPAVDMHSKEPFFNDFYVSIQNRDSVDGAVVTTYTYIRTE